MPLPLRSRIGAYEIVGILGAGGMGEVYRAHDTRLRREAAIKILPGIFATDPEHLARFEREARTLASLNHPNIAQVYGLEHTADGRALVMEYVDGEDLAQRMARGPIPLEEALLIARQIAEALEAAHEAGIVHRDLKPGNIRVRPDGTVKVLDFGLAKTLEAAAMAGSGAGPENPTITSPVTAGTVILGTLAYMAPEQARGKAVDKRADIWAFGVVLYEIITGRRAFEGDTVSDTLAAVLTREPDYSLLPPATPAAVRVLLQRTLQRDARQRLRDIGEARVALSAMDVGSSETPSVVPGAVTRSRWRRARPLGAIAAAMVIAIAVTAWALSRSPSPAETAMLSLGIDAGGDTPLAGVGWVGLNWVGPTAILSPDGRVIAFIARGPAGGRWQLYARRLDELRAAPIAGTEGAYAPFFSPDGRFIAFFAGGSLSKVALAGGAVTAISPAPDGRGGAWAPDDTIVFAPRPDGPLFRVSAAGGAAAPFTTLHSSGETTHRWPQVLPGGRHVLFTSHDDANSSRAGTIEVQPLAGGERTVLQTGGLYGRYASSGHLLYLQDGKLFAASFDLSRLQVTGRPVPIVDEVAHSTLNGTAQYSLSDTGLLAYRRALNSKRVLQWMDSAGQLQKIRDIPAEYEDVRFPAEPSRVLLTIAEGGQEDVWVYDIAADRMSRLTFSTDNDRSPIWSPDGGRFAYASWSADVGAFNIFVHRTDGTGEPQRVTTSQNQQSPVAWHPSGRYLLYTEDRAGTGTDVMLLPVELTATGQLRGGKPEVVLGSQANESSARFSPDGAWLAYTSDESGRSEVFVQPFPATGGRWQVSSEGAEWIEWRKQLFYGRSEEVVMSVPYRVDGRTFVAEKPRMWMRIPAGVLWVEPNPDGSRAAVIRSEDARRESMVLVVNFFDYLRRRVDAPPP